MSAYQGLSVSWDSHTDPCSIQPCTSKLTLSILSLFSLGSVPTKEFIKAIKTTTNLLKKTSSSSLAKFQFENVSLRCLLNIKEGYSTLSWSSRQRSKQHKNSCHVSNAFSEEFRNLVAIHVVFARQILKRRSHDVFLLLQYQL